jgi:hypothetical protein
MKVILVLGQFLIHFNALGEDAFIDNIEFAGSGCKQEDAIAVLSPDQRVLSLLFDNFIVEAGGEQSRRNKKNCNIKIMIAAPEGKRIVIDKIHYRGYAFVPSKARMNFKSSYHFEIPSLGMSSRSFLDVITRVGDVDEDLFVEQQIKGRVLNRACGEDVLLNIKTNLTVMTSGSQEEAYVSIDSLDSGIDYHVRYESCVSTRSRSQREIQNRRVQAEHASRANRHNRAMQVERRERRMRSPRVSSRNRSGQRVSRPAAPSRVRRENEVENRRSRIMRTRP